MEDDYIIVSPNTLMEERRAPVDIFFRTLAEQHAQNAVAVILSGTGADGSMGLKRIKEKGGAVFVQNPREAEYSDMPHNAIATELIDEILHVAEIPAKIIAYKNGMGTVIIPIPHDALPENQQASLREIFTQLRIKTGHDFSNYKRASVLRRIERRINIHQLLILCSWSAPIAGLFDPFRRGRFRSFDGGNRYKVPPIRGRWKMGRSRRSGIRPPRR